MQDSMYKRFIENLILASLLMIMLTECDLFAWDKMPDFEFGGVILNSSDFELLVIQGTDTANYHQLDSFYLKPKSSIIFRTEGFYDNDKNIQDEFFKFGGYRPPIEQTRVFREDRLVANWIGPPRYMNDSIQDFYNINCWKQTFDEETNKGEYTFTISLTD